MPRCVSVWLSTTSSVEQSSVPFLPVNPELSTMRNQGRQKLARFSPREFASLVIDILTDAKRRQSPNGNSFHMSEINSEFSNPIYFFSPFCDNWLLILQICLAVLSICFLRSLSFHLKMWLLLLPYLNGLLQITQSLMNISIQIPPDQKYVFHVRAVLHCERFSPSGKMYTISVNENLT